MSDPATNYTNSTESTTQKIQQLLAAAQPTWSCQVFSGTSTDDMANILTGLPLPAAVVRYVDSQWRAEPFRRKSNYEVALVCANSDMESCGTTIRGMIDSAVSALDTQVYNQAWIRADSDSGIDIGPNKCAALLKITVEDY